MAEVMKGGNVSMGVKWRIRSSIIVTTLICIRDMNIECHTAITNTIPSGNKLYRRW